MNYGSAINFLSNTNRNKICLSAAHHNVVKIVLQLSIKMV